MRIFALTDSLVPWHSFWIRFGQYLPNLKYTIEIINDPKRIDELMIGDQLFFYRFSQEWNDLSDSLALARQRGVTIFSDVDDYLWEAKGWSRERLFGVTQALRKCSLITCSTNELKKQLEIMFPCIPIVTITNTAPLIPKKIIKKKQDAYIRIGWTGAPWTRPEDIEILIPLAQWIRSNPDYKIKLVHVGHYEGKLSLADILKIPGDLVEKHPLQDHENYLRNLNFDIGLAPLKNSTFNQFKSSIKLLEYSCLGIPWVASDIQPYKEICRTWNWKGRLCKIGEDWITKINPLLNRNIRMEEGSKIQELCKAHSSFNSGVSQWDDLLSMNNFYFDHSKVT